MGSRSAVGALAGQLLPLTCGAALVLALQARFYACFTVVALVGIWRIAAVVWPLAPSRPRGETAAPASPAEVEQRLLASLLDQTPAPLLIRRDDGVIRAGNRAARHLFHTDDRLSPPPAALVTALSGPAAEAGTLSLDGPAGPHAYALSITDLSEAEGRVRLAVLIDIQPELRAAEAAALRELLQVLGHEIMNALTPVASLAATACDLLADERPASTRLARDAVETLARRAGGLARFVEAYRTLARLPPPVLAPTPPALLIEEAAKLFHSRWQGRVVLLIEPSPEGTARLDMDLMIHALMNVLANAAEAALEGDRPPTVVLTAAFSGGQLTLSVSDSGRGVPEALREQIFQPFYTTRAQGTGVGLSFARQVALSHGGQLVLRPPGEGGACFAFLLAR